MVSAGNAANLSTTDLKLLSLEQLVEQEVVSVSRRAEALGEAASAIQVIQGDEIRRSGATRLPEALRLASNLQVAQIDSSQWAISARGFNSPLANKLLVMIDGRTVYSPLFAGVFWDIQDVMLEDVDTIEVVSGPGGTLWGANAVNGVINVRTKKAKDTQGFFVAGGGGTELRQAGAVRYGGTLGRSAHFRVYGKYSNRDGNIVQPVGETDEDWRMAQGGFRVDWEVSDGNLVTLQGDLYENRIPRSGDEGATKGGNLTGRWSHTLSQNSGFTIQMYYDRVHRKLPGSYNDRLDTYDFDFQHNFSWNQNNEIVWGAGYRRVVDEFQPGTIVVLPQHLTLETFSAFAQDEIAIAKDKLHLTVGTKVEHNDYTGIEWQPSARIAWKLDESQTSWAAVSRAVRTPSRLDRDLFIPGVTEGSPDFDSEELIAWELGYRVQPSSQLSLAAATFYHDYDGIRSTESAGPDATLPLAFGNGQRGESYGAELTADYQATDWWRLHAGITELRVSIEPKPGSADTSFGALEAADSKHYYSIQSQWILPGHVEAYAGLRYVSSITNPLVGVPGYTELDARVTWNPSEQWGFSIAGRNLLHDSHVEYGDAALLQEIERSIYAIVQWNP